eukprot:NODE_22775_length_694_cov_9.253968.p5 GENE.NODE_22775_length_694_cov_9.253968~~NODE_22775_length_694_cov_9.253968.p5  ORF type:complete len:66 (-),score=8.03 NODE_22775_length_694_cov_9.253968:273-470(-)
MLGPAIHIVKNFAATPSPRRDTPDNSLLAGQVAELLEQLLHCSHLLAADPGLQLLRSIFTGQPCG